MVKILVVEDDTKLNSFVCNALNNNGYTAKGCSSANETYNLMYNDMYDMIISDIMMPGEDGFEFAQTVRGINKNIPILFMTARDDFPSMQRGYEIGIDDYMIKPIDINELLLRIGALLRRANILNQKKLTVGNLMMDADKMTVTIDEKSVGTSVREFNILFKLLSYPDRPFTRAGLMDEFWGIDDNATLRAVDVYITRLRDKFSSCDGFKIITMYGLGYKAVLS